MDRVSSSRKQKRLQARNPYHRPGTTKRKSISPPATPGGIFQSVKRLFSPSSWLGSAKKPLQEEDDVREDKGVEEEDESDVEDSQPVYPQVTETPVSHHLSSETSPNQILASFFENRANTALSPIEIEGVMSLMQKAASSASPATPSGVAPAKPPSMPQSIFTPVKQVSSQPSIFTNMTSPASGPRQSTPDRIATSARRPHFYSASGGTSSPFRRRRVLSTSRPQSLASSPEEIRKRQVSSINLNAAQEPDQVRKIKSKTAASILSILDGDKGSAQPEQPEQLSQYLNPFASAGFSPRKTRVPPKRPSPETPTPKTAVEEIVRTATSPAKSKPMPSPAPNISSYGPNSFRKNGFKPIVSSRLRNVEVLRDEDDDEGHHRTVEEKRDGKKDTNSHLSVVSPVFEVDKSSTVDTLAATETSMPLDGPKLYPSLPSLDPNSLIPEKKESISSSKTSVVPNIDFTQSPEKRSGFVYGHEGGVREKVLQVAVSDLARYSFTIETKRRGGDDQRALPVYVFSI